MNQSKPDPTVFMRRWLIHYLYLAAFVHFLIGLLLPWVMAAELFEPYHKVIEQAFWQGSAPTAARQQQLWWISLFGATVQTVGLWMAALIYLGQRYRSTFVWSALFFGLVIWAPQDILISMQANVWQHVWVDLLVLAALLPPLLWLWRHDARATPMSKEPAL